MKNIKGVIFDLDHTLFDRYSTFSALQNDFYNAFKKYLSDETTPRDMCIALKNGDKKFLYYGWDKIAEYVFSLGLFSVNISAEVFKEIVFSCFEKKAIPFEYSIPVIDKLKSNGYKIGLITNGKSQLQRKKLSMLNLNNKFDEIIISGEFGKHKPDLTIFYEMSKRLNISEEKLIYVGDHPINDIDAASKAGYKTVWVKTNGTWIEGCATPDFSIDTVKSLPSLLGLD